jgi:hypothetical protein
VRRQGRLTLRAVCPRAALSLVVGLVSTGVPRSATAAEVVGPSPEETLGHGLGALSSASEPCAGAGRKRRFGDVIVAITLNPGPPTFSIDVSRSLGPAAPSCVLARIRPVLARMMAEMPKTGRVVHGVFEIGDRSLTPVLSPSLFARLPPDASPAEAGCLWLRGTPAFSDGFRRGLNRDLSPVSGDWAELLSSQLGIPVGSFRDAWVQTATTSLVVWSQPAAGGDDPGPRAKLCKVPLDASRSLALSARLDGVAPCLEGDLPDRLVNPRFAFPARRYRRIVALSRGACALDDAGRVACCGRGVAPFADSAGFVWIEASRTHLCAVTSAGATTCRDRASWRPDSAPGPVRRYSVEGSRRCSIDAAGGATCADGAGVARSAGPFTEIDAGTGCALSGDGHVSCARQGQFRPIAADIVQLAPCDVGAPAAIGLARNGTLLRIAGDQANATALTATEIAGLPPRLSSVSCRGPDLLGIAEADHRLVVAPPAPLPPDVKDLPFAQTSTSETLACGVTMSAAVVCWGETDRWNVSGAVHTSP